MKLSQSVTYAVQAAVRLAEGRDGPPISCARLAESGGMPERFLLQILRDLTKQGILQSTRGGGGGFVLDRPPEEVTLLELVEAIDGPLAAGLPTNSTLSEAAADVISQTLKRVAECSRQQLAAVTLADLLQRPATGPAPRTVTAPPIPLLRRSEPCIVAAIGR